MNCLQLMKAQPMTGKYLVAKTSSHQQAHPQLVPSTKNDLTPVDNDTTHGGSSTIVHTLNLPIIFCIV
jgi:hypothetical protein